MGLAEEERGRPRQKQKRAFVEVPVGAVLLLALPLILINLLLLWTFEQHAYAVCVSCEDHTILLSYTVLGILFSLVHWRICEYLHVNVL